MESNAKDHNPPKAGQVKKEEKPAYKTNSPVKEKSADSEAETNNKETTKDKKENVSGFDDWSVSWP
ncbi:MAG: hypothetical protein EOO91_00995 [Pedobacter sp.]|nr:MAG: hypothetical protein EOO91_00995 [Pedobacter sp.]